MLRRHARILARFWKNSLMREMTFRGHFVLNALGEISWVVLLLIFIGVIFDKTPEVRGWSQTQYLFLVGTHMVVTGLFETFFFGNCWRISKLVRSGDLDFVLCKPANVQFLLSFEQIDLSPLAGVPVGLGICTYALIKAGTVPAAWQVGLFLLLIAAGVAILYALLFMFAVTSVWLIRQTGLDHLWFYAVSVARYPAEIYRTFWSGILWIAFVFVVPLLLVSNLPAAVMTRSFQPALVAYALVSACVLLVLSTVVCRVALKWYRSASS